MGCRGNVVRDVADMILERDDLAAMLIAIEHGRVIHADIKKAVRSSLSSNTYGVRRYGPSMQARSVSFVALSAAQLLHAFSARPEKNNIFDFERASPDPYLPGSVVGGIARRADADGPDHSPLARLGFHARLRLGGGDGQGDRAALANEMVKAARFAPARLAASRGPALLAIAAE